MVATRSKFTADRKKTIIQAFKDGHGPTNAAAKGGISKRTLYYWFERGEKHPDGAYGKFVQEVAEASAKAADVAIKSVTKAFPDDWRAAMEFLSRRFPDEWAKRKRHEFFGPKGEPIRVEVKWPTDGPGF